MVMAVSWATVSIPSKPARLTTRDTVRENQHLGNPPRQFQALGRSPPGPHDGDSGAALQ